MRSDRAAGTVIDAGIDTNSPLWNRDLAPTAPSQRTWSTYDFAALWIGLDTLLHAAWPAWGAVAGSTWLAFLPDAVLTALTGRKAS